MNARYAICYAPQQGSPLAAFGARWLGRDAVAGVRCLQTSIQGIGEDAMQAWTEGPREAGFCAVLRPPFHLPRERSPQQLLRAMADFAAARPPLTLPPLGPVMHGRRLCLAPRTPAPQAQDLAAQCVTRFDDFRDPAPRSDVPPPVSHPLSPRQQVLLERFGHPHVLEQFLFRFELTGPLPRSREVDSLTRAALALTAPLGREPLEIRELCVLRQARPGAWFIIHKRFPLAGGNQSVPPLQARAI